MPDPLRNMFPGGRLSGAKMDVSGTPVGSNVGRGSAGRGALPAACAARGELTNAASHAATDEREMLRMAPTGLEKDRTKKTKTEAASRNQAASVARARTAPANPL